MKHICLLLLVYLGLCNSGTSRTIIDRDSSSFTFRYEDYLNQVRKFHPNAQSAGLLLLQAEAGLRAARGGFDPKLDASYEDKYFKSTNYWRVGEAKLKWKSPMAVQLEAGYNIADGAFLSPEFTLPDPGQTALGLKVPVLQGLFMDYERTQMRKARAYQEVLNFQRQLEMNKLLYQASLAYWDWSFSFAAWELFQEVLQRSEARFVFIRETYLAGDAAEIDTVEAFTQLQQVRLGLIEAEINLRKSRRLLDIFIWADIPQSIQPEPLISSTLEVNEAVEDLLLIDPVIGAHPQLRQLNSELKAYEAERRWKAEQLKPQLDVKYQLLSNASGNESFAWTRNLDPANYKWGISFNFPLFLRKERASLQMAKLKIQETQLKSTQKETELLNKSEALQFQLGNMQQQIAMFSSLYQNIRRLMEAEEIKFRAGESTIFLLNSRELKYLDAGQKQLDLQRKYLKAWTEWMGLMAGFQV